MKKNLAIFIVLLGLSLAVYYVAESHRENKTAKVASSVRASTKNPEKLPVIAPIPPTISVTPAKVFQGEPFAITINGITSTSSVKRVTFNTTSLAVFSYNSKIESLGAVDLNQKPGVYTARVELLGNGTTTILTKSVTVVARPKVEAPLGIPEKLGGNTVTSQNALVTSLVSEADELRKVQTVPQTLWKGNFIYPVKNPIITDTYGYSRQTGAYSIAHKGTDFRALEGTPVYAMNSGVVRLEKKFRDYGNTIVLDHGQGIMTLYLHLSEFKVAQGQKVEKGELIGLSGSTGYAEGPHLHLSVKINTISIDPMKFLELFGAAQ